MLVRRRFSQSKTHLRVIVVTGRSCVLPIAFGALITAPATLDLLILTHCTSRRTERSRGYLD